MGIHWIIFVVCWRILPSEARSAVRVEGKKEKDYSCWLGERSEANATTCFHCKGARFAEADSQWRNLLFFGPGISHSGSHSLLLTLGFLVYLSSESGFISTKDFWQEHLSQ